MIARLQQATTLGLLILALAWLGLFLRAGEAAWAVGGALAIVLGYAVLLALEFSFLTLAHGDDPAPRATLTQLVRAWAGEVLTAPRVFGWRQPFRSTLQPDAVPDRPEGRVGVVFVHGFFCNRGLWNPWLVRLRARGVPFIAVNLEPAFGSIDAYPPIIDAAVRRLALASGRPPVIVAHSMGGLATRAWLARRAPDARVQRVVTVGTPHRGTWLARYGFATNARQMRLGSRWLRQLAELEAGRGEVCTQVPFTCFYSHCDNIAFPPSTGTLPGADNRHVPGSAHVHLAFRPEVYDEVWRSLDPAATATPAASAAVSATGRPDGGRQ
jgi:triacylglycerol lipase